MSVLPAVAGGVAADLSSTSLALARAFHRGATLWCLSPCWPQHADHVAVEFVHPVIVGKRALPADVVRGPEPLAVLRTLAAPGDVLVAIGPDDERQIAAAMRRGPAWGVETVWLGSGTRPPAGAADHVLWCDDPDAAYSGELVVLYHLLWELTHVCFEHPGLLSLPRDHEAEAVCITCSDQAVLGEVVRRGPDETAVVRTAEGTTSVDTTMVGPLRRHDLVLVHAGVALDVVREGPAG